MVTTKKVVTTTTPAPGPEPNYCDVVVNGVGYQTKDGPTGWERLASLSSQFLTFVMTLICGIIFTIVTLIVILSNGVKNTAAVCLIVTTIVSFSVSIYNKVQMGKVPDSWVTGECEINKKSLIG